MSFPKAFTKQLAAAVAEKRLSVGDFITAIASSNSAGPQPRISQREILLCAALCDSTDPEERGLGGQKSRDITWQGIADARAAAASGHVFDMGSFDTLTKLAAPALEAFEAGRLVAPYPHTLFVARASASYFRDEGPEAEGEVPIGILASADAPGAPAFFTAFIIKEGARGGLNFLALGSIAVRSEEAPPGTSQLKPVFDDSGLFDINRLKQNYATFSLVGLATLLLVNDDRLEFRRDVPAPALNKARAKSGKPPLPPVWRMPNAAAVAAYVTKLGIKGAASRTSKGGTHASPVQHERRGHLRRLLSGRITKVRSSLVGGLDKHLTRTRAFYEVKA